MSPFIALNLPTTMYFDKVLLMSGAWIGLHSTIIIKQKYVTHSSDLCQLECRHTLTAKLHRAGLQQSKGIT